jgi:hypothetical protein
MNLSSVLRSQEGVVSRRQVLTHGLDDDDIDRLLRRREWARLFRGVYVDHTGPPTWRQRAWAATLLHAPAALDGGSALSAWGVLVPDREDVIELVVDAGRRVVDPPGVRTMRTRAWERTVQLNLSPPRVRLEPAALTAASRLGSGDRAAALLGDLVQQRRTTATRLQAALAELSRLPRHALLTEVLDDVSTGALSALERRYLQNVERAHRLPHGHRQHRVTADGTRQQRDVDYPSYGLDVELDGRLGHELWRDRWADLDRDLHGLRDGTITIRAGWGQVLQPCRLAAGVAAVLAARGWDGRPARCGPGCVLT